MDVNNFEVVTKTVKTLDGSEMEVTELVFRRVLDPELHKALLDITDDENFYNDEAKLSPRELYEHLKTLQQRVEGGNMSLLMLTVYLNDFFKDSIEQFKGMSEDGKITFKQLHNLFEIGTKFVAETPDGHKVGSTVLKTGTVQTFGGALFEVTGTFTFTSGSGLVQKIKSFYIPHFGGLKKSTDLNVRPMTPEDEAELTERGRVFAKYAMKTHYIHYEGNMFRKSMYGNIYTNSTGRIMIDYVGFKTVNPNHDYGHHEDTKCEPVIPEELLYMTWYTLHGFSFRTKQWGELYVRDISEIKFDDHAFDYLVLEEDTKDMINVLVTNVGVGFTDIITGKSGGFIGLLSGPPGVGKTLLCEAISEKLHKPLYSITVGELGTTPSELEIKLTRILEIANTWDAVVLIDEADVFMETRKDNDVNRNAMVCIFLRLLERYQGVMFLTTNRADTLDNAFKSRISIHVPFTELTPEVRKQIIVNLIKASGVAFDEEMIETLSHKNVNGRQIKNIIRMSQCLSVGKKEPITMKTIEKVLKFT
jgi:adenylate kinase family enzyme